jgi:hypothetical protein
MRRGGLAGRQTASRQGASTQCESKLCYLTSATTRLVSTHYPHPSARPTDTFYPSNYRQFALSRLGQGPLSLNTQSSELVMCLVVRLLH